jgi:hypothetical protein
MKRTFNYTGRRKIERRDVSITLREDRGTWVFDADLRLAEYHFPRNAEVWLEAHRQNLWMQFAWGTVSAMHPATNRRLTEFDVPDGILFRVRVVQPSGQEHHKLLGEADALNFVKAGEASDKRRPLLEPVPDALDQLLWKLDLERDPPVLLVNKDAKPTWKDLARSQHFLALVYPEVLRRLLTRVLLDDKWSEDDEDAGWQGDWVRFARSIGVSIPLPNPDQKQDREAWIDEAVAAFARRHQLRTNLDLSFEEETRP